MFSRYFRSDAKPTGVLTLSRSLGEAFIAKLAPTSPGTVEIESSAPSEVLKENTARLGSEWVNASSNAIWLALGRVATIGSGDVYLAPGGGSWNGMIGGKVWVGSVSAIAAAGSKNKMTCAEG